MRKLASIQLVSAAEPIPKADAIERLRILGWSVVAKKGDFQPGDAVVYCEIDSLLPERPEFEFLRPSCFKPVLTEGERVIQRAGFRIKTVKLRGQVSQGICFPSSILNGDGPREIGDDITEELGIIKYEPPIPAGMGGRVKGAFPAFLPKTDEVRVQVLNDLIKRNAGKTLAMTEKLDGTSFTAFLLKDEFGICSRNQWIDETDRTNLLVRLAEELKLAEKLRMLRDKFGFDPAIQGEVIGPGIQGNKYALPRVELFVFNLLRVENYCLVDRTDQTRMLEHAALKSVPALGNIVLNHTIDELVALSVGTSLLNPKVQREGIVFRPETETHDHDVGGRLSFKVINPQFLLKFDE